MGPKRTPKLYHKLLCVLCKFPFENASDLAFHLCSVHTGLDDGVSQHDGGGYFVCAKCGNQKKRKRRKEFHNIDRERHHCYTEYALDEDKDFYYAEVIVGVTLARRLAKRAYQKYEEEVDVETLDQWLPRGTGLGDAVPHVEEYHAGDHKQKSTYTFGEDAVLTYIKLKEFDLGTKGKKGDDALSPGVSGTGTKDKKVDDALSPGVSGTGAKGKGGDDALSPGVSGKGASKTKPTGDASTVAKSTKGDVSMTAKVVPNPLYKGDTSSLPREGDVSPLGAPRGAMTPLRFRNLIVTVTPLLKGISIREVFLSGITLALVSKLFGLLMRAVRRVEVPPRTVAVPPRRVLSRVVGVVLMIKIPAILGILRGNVPRILPEEYVGKSLRRVQKP